MTAPHGESIVNDFIRRLNNALDDLPRAQRAEIITEISEHIQETRLEQGEGDGCPAARDARPRWHSGSHRG